MLPHQPEQLSKTELVNLVYELQNQLADHKQAFSRDIETRGSYIEGKVTVKEGHFVGRDQGLSGEEVNQIIKTLLKYFPHGTLDPAQLDSTLNQFRQYHNQLHEWKELHNGLDEILTAFAPYKSSIERIERNRRIPKLKEIRGLWRQVSSKVTTLLDWAHSIQHIGQPYRLLEKREMKGEKWAVQLSRLHQDVSRQLGFNPSDMSHPNLFPTTYPNATKSILFRYFGFEIKWWSEVYELTQTFYHNVTQHMTLTDKQLRRTATELYRLSQRRFGVTGT